eukprot:gene7668-595_t
MVTNLLIGFGFLFTGIIVYMSSPGASLFPWHPTLMAVAFLGLMTYGISMFAPGQTLSYQDRVWRHFLCNTSAAFLACGGFLVIYINKDLREKPHFTTWHGFVGLLVTLTVAIQSAGSAIFISPSISARILGARNIKPAKKIHRYASIVTYFAVIFEMTLAYYSNFWTRLVDGHMWTLITIGTAFMAFLVLAQVFRFGSKLKE